MSGNIVFYFSGTGNSYYAAKKLSMAVQAELRPIVSLNKGDRIDASLLIFVFPVYDFKPPKIFTEIIDNLAVIKANKIIAIATYGVALFSTLFHFEKTLLNKQVTLSQGYGVKSPHNAVGSIGFSEKEDNIKIVKAEYKIDEIINRIKSNTFKKIEKTAIFDDLTIVTKLPHAFRLISILIFKGGNSLAFTVTKDCINCHLCENICAMQNINCGTGKPRFGDKCASCFACIQWCPMSAIHIGKYSFKQIGIKNYHHPKVKATDLILNQFDKSQPV